MVQHLTFIRKISLSLVFILFLDASFQQQQEEKPNYCQQSEDNNCIPQNRPKRIALVAQKKVIVEPFYDYFIANQGKYDWELYNKNNLPLDVKPDFIFGFANQYMNKFTNKCLKSAFHNQMFLDNKKTWRDMLINFDKQSQYSFKSTDFHPKSYAVKPTYRYYDQEEKEFFKIKDKNEMWLEKNPTGLDSKGISVVSNLTEYKKYLREKKQKGQKYLSHQSPIMLVQKYLQNPLLLNKKKFDFRSFILMFCLGEKFIFFYDHSYIRLSLQDFSMENHDFEIHTTTTRHAKKFKNDHDIYEQKLNEAQKTIPEFEQMYKTEYNKTDIDVQKLYVRMQKVLTYSFIASKSVVSKNKGAFHLFGCDVMIDDQEKAWVFEVNVYPALHTFSPAKSYSMPPLIKNTVELLMYFLENWDDMETAALNHSQIPLGSYKIVYNEVSGYNVINEQE